jgi:hypothetical protein
MKIREFINEVGKITKENIPGDFNVIPTVSSNGFGFSIGVEINYVDPSCILSDKSLSILEADVSLKDGEEYKITYFSTFPGFKGATEEIDLEKFLEIYREVLCRNEETKVIFNSIIGK